MYLWRYVYRHPEHRKELAERGRPRPDREEKVPPESTQSGAAAPQGRAAVKDWAGFFLCDPGR